MFRDMRRRDKEIVKEDILEILNKGEYGYLATIGENGYPYGIPVNYVFYEDNIYFHCATAGYKLDNIKKNPKVTFNVVTDVQLLPQEFSTKYKSVVVFGEASEVADDLKDVILFELIKKYSKEFLEEGKKYINTDRMKTKIIEINIHHMTGKSQI